MPEIESPSGNIYYCELTGGAYLRLREGEINLGALEDCDEECPAVLLDDLRGLRQSVKDALDYGRACQATAREADMMRHYPGDWM